MGREKLFWGRIQLSFILYINKASLACQPRTKYSNRFTTDPEFKFNNDTQEISLLPNFVRGQASSKNSLKESDNP